MASDPSIKIRPATENDIPQVHAIYSHYVNNTVLTFMQNPPPLESMVSKFKHITAVRGLPYLLAVEVANDTVLGYTYLSPFRGTMISYGPSVELSLFLHPQYSCQGLGTSLLSALLSSLGPYSYANGESAGRSDGVWHRAIEHAGYQYYEVIADSIPIRNVIACMALDPEAKDGGEGLRRWYEKRGFVETGRLKGVGYKKMKWSVYSI
jgi:L-amino acid N-acyltransferase YncA